MIAYNVTLKLDTSIEEAWIKWMTDIHMPELIDTGLFFDYKLCRLLEQDESEGVTYVAQYFCKDLNAYNTYISEYAQQMREKGFKQFGDKFVAFRTVMEVVAEAVKK